MTDNKTQTKLYQSSDGVCISYLFRECENASHTLLMLHGLASNHSRWSEFVSNTQLADKMNLIWLDLRGHGKSHSKCKINHNIWQQDLFGILQQESQKKVIIVGHSMGAQIALHFTLQHPSFVESLVLIDPTLPKKLKGKLAIAKRLRFFLKLLITILRLINKLPITTKTYPDRDLQALDRKTRLLMNSQSVEIIAKLYTTPAEDLKYMSLLNYLQDLYATTQALPDLKNIKCPVKILLSKGSTIVDASEMKSYFSSNNALEITEIDANHWPLTEKPEETRHLIEDWCLNQIEKSATI